MANSTIFLVTSLMLLAFATGSVLQKDSVDVEMEAIEIIPMPKEFCTWCPVVIDTINFDFIHGNLTEQLLTALDIACRLLQTNPKKAEQCIAFTNAMIPAIIKAFATTDIRQGYKICHMFFNCSLGPFGNSAEITGSLEMSKNEIGTKLKQPQYSTLPANIDVLKCQGCMAISRFVEKQHPDIYFSAVEAILFPFPFPNFGNFCSNATSKKSTDQRLDSSNFCVSAGICDDYKIKTQMLIPTADNDAVSSNADCLACSLSVAVFHRTLLNEKAEYQTNITTAIENLICGNQSREIIDICTNCPIVCTLACPLLHHEIPCLPAFPRFECVLLIEQFVTMLMDRFVAQTTPENVCLYSGACDVPTDGIF